MIRFLIIAVSIFMIQSCGVKIPPKPKAERRIAAYIEAYPSLKSEVMSTLKVETPPIKFSNEVDMSSSDEYIDSVLYNLYKTNPDRVFVMSDSDIESVRENIKEQFYDALTLSIKDVDTNGVKVSYELKEDGTLLQNIYVEPFEFKAKVYNNIAVEDKPPFWENNWFFSTMFLLVLVIILVIFK